jgi:hypothetical protein
MFAILKKIPPWGWVILGFLSLNLATCGWYPSVWTDEVAHSDPAANLYFGHGLTSTMFSQPSGEYWVGNPPLFMFLLFGWFKLVGFGIFQYRAFGYLLWSAGVALLCLAVRRARLIRSPLALAVLASLLFAGYAVVFNYRSGRYDPLILVVVAACFLAFTIPHPGWRRLAVFFSAALFLPTALTVGPFAAAFGCLVFLVTGRKFFMELACTALGLAAGFGALYAYVCGLGMWETYRRITVLAAQSYYPAGQATPVWQRKLAGFPPQARPGSHRRDFVAGPAGNFFQLPEKAGCDRPAAGGFGNGHFFPGARHGAGRLCLSDLSLLADLHSAGRLSGGFAGSAAGTFSGADAEHLSGGPGLGRLHAGIGLAAGAGVHRPGRAGLFQGGTVRGADDSSGRCGDG